MLHLVDILGIIVAQLGQDCSVDKSFKFICKICNRH